MALTELDIVKLRVPLPQAGIAVGALGTVLEVFGDPVEAYLVEVCDAHGETLFMGELKPDQVAPTEVL